MLMAMSWPLVIFTLLDGCIFGATQKVRVIVECPDDSCPSFRSAREISWLPNTFALGTEDMRMLQSNATVWPVRLHQLSARRVEESSTEEDTEEAFSFNDPLYPLQWYLVSPRRYC